MKEREEQCKGTGKRKDLGGRECHADIAGSVGELFSGHSHGGPAAPALKDPHTPLTQHTVHTHMYTHKHAPLQLTALPARPSAVQTTSQDAHTEPLSVDTFDYCFLLCNVLIRIIWLY